MPDATPSPDAVGATALLGGLAVDHATAERIARSVGGVTAAARDFQDALVLDDAPNDVLRLRADAAAAPR